MEFIPIGLNAIYNYSKLPKIHSSVYLKILYNILTLLTYNESNTFCKEFRNI